MAIRHMDGGGSTAGGFVETDGDGKAFDRINVSAPVVCLERFVFFGKSTYPTRPLPAPSSTLSRRVTRVSHDKVVLAFMIP